MSRTTIDEHIKIIVLHKLPVDSNHSADIQDILCKIDAATKKSIEWIVVKWKENASVRYQQLECVHA